MVESRLVLASRSPRRARVLEAAGIAFRRGPFPDVDETVPPGLSPPEIVRSLAERKACAVLTRVEVSDVVLAADTLVFLGTDAITKPRDPADAVAILSRLSGRTHQVATGVAVGHGSRVESDVAVARVRFRELSLTEIEAYVATGEPLDKAGAYGIQGGAAGFVEEVEGDLDTVVGLPMVLVRRLLSLLDSSGLGWGEPRGR